MITSVIDLPLNDMTHGLGKQQLCHCPLWLPTMNSTGVGQIFAAASPALADHGAGHADSINIFRSKKENLKISVYNYK